MIEAVIGEGLQRRLMDVLWWVEKVQDVIIIVIIVVIFLVIGIIAVFAISIVIAIGIVVSVMGGGLLSCQLAVTTRCWSMRPI